MTKKEKHKHEMCDLTLDVTSANINTLIKALSELGQAELGYEKYGRRAINGLCVAIEYALCYMDDAELECDE